MTDEPVAMLNDEQLAARRALIDVHCGGCGASFPGDTRLNNGLCRECCRSPVHLIRKVERYRQALERIDAEVGRTQPILGEGPRLRCIQSIARKALDA